MRGIAVLGKAVTRDRPGIPRSRIVAIAATTTIVIAGFLTYDFLNGLDSTAPGSHIRLSNDGGAEYNVTLVPTGPNATNLIINAQNPCSGYLPSGGYHRWSCVWALEWGYPDGGTYRGDIPPPPLPLYNASVAGQLGSVSSELYGVQIWSPSEVPFDGQGQSIIAVTGEAQLGGSSEPTLYWSANLTIAVGP